MLAVPLLIGVAVGGFGPWQIVLAAAAATGYLAVISLQTWLRARRREKYALSVAVFGAAAALLAVALAATHPWLLLAAVVLVPAAAVLLATSRPGQPRTLIEGVAEVAQALVLVPSAAYLTAASTPGDASVVRATLVAAIYLLGTVLAVRSVIRERDNAAFGAFSVTAHVVGAAIALAFLPAVYAVLFALLAVRAAALPIVRRSWATTTHPLRPVHVGLVEMVASAALVALAFAVPV